MSATSSALPALTGEAAELLAGAVQALTCALQPIVDVHLGVVHGVEALMRGQEALGCETPFDLLDRFSAVGAIVALEEVLARKAIEAFAASPLGARGGEARLFLNIDGRALLDPHQLILERSVRLITAAGLPASSLCIELSERYGRFSAPHLELSIHRLRGLGVKFAADDFGQGHSELKLLFDQTVDYVKIDRYFIAGVDASDRQKVFLSSMCRFAHVLGVRVIAEGVETQGEFETCRNLGCDLIQGWFVAPPHGDPTGLLTAYPHVAEAAARMRRQREREDGGDGVIATVMSEVPIARDTTSIDELIELFRRHADADLCVVVDAAGEPLGTIKQSTLRPVVYNRYGRDLLHNEGYRNALRALINPCACVDVERTVSQVLDVFMAHPGAHGVMVTLAGRFIGFLTADALLKLANARYLSEALDRNPLTGLPGNNRVAARIAGLLEDRGGVRQRRYLCYFDFDNFKPFNDHKGFRQGDRAITLFAEVLQRRFGADPGGFIGHLGGDDFVGVFEGYPPEALRMALSDGLEEFAATVKGMYAEAERARGWVECPDRFGTVRRFPLLRCSVSVIEFPPGVPAISAADLDSAIARLKGEAKSAAAGMAWQCLPDTRAAAG